MLGVHSWHTNKVNLPQTWGELESDSWILVSWSVLCWKRKRENYVAPALQEIRMGSMQDIWSTSGGSSGTSDQSGIYRSDSWNAHHHRLLNLPTCWEQCMKSTRLWLNRRQICRTLVRLVLRSLPVCMSHHHCHEPWPCPVAGWRSRNGRWQDTWGTHCVPCSQGGAYLTSINLSHFVNNQNQKCKNKSLAFLSKTLKTMQTNAHWQTILSFWWVMERRKICCPKFQQMTRFLVSPSAILDQFFVCQEGSFGSRKRESQSGLSF